MKGNNTYTGDGDDLDLVTLEENKQGEKKRKRLNDSVEGAKKKKQKKKAGKPKKNLCVEEIDNINIRINKCTGRKGGRGTEKGMYSTHRDRK